MPRGWHEARNTSGRARDLTRRKLEPSVRSDMYQVIIERPRGGAGWGRDWPRWDWRQAVAYAEQIEPTRAAASDCESAPLADGTDDLSADPPQPRLHGFSDGGPNKLRMGPRSRSKWLSENLAPLRRFLRRRLGRPWNDVHSEICAQIGVRSAVQKHVLDHLRHYVELHPVLVAGYPHHPAAHSGTASGLQPLSDYGNSFYVCPLTGTLQLAGHPRRRAKKPPAPTAAPTAQK